MHINSVHTAKSKLTFGDNVLLKNAFNYFNHLRHMYSKNLERKSEKEMGRIKENKKGQVLRIEKN